MGDRPEPIEASGMTGGSDFAEGRNSSPSLLRRLWFRLRLLFRWIARLFGAAPPAESVAPADSDAFAFERSPEGPPFTDVNHPILRTLRRRALNDLFEWLDLDFVPGQLLERSDHSADPISAFTTFLRSVGCDPEAVRRRDPEELNRLRDVVDLLMAFGSLTRWLQPAQRDALQLLLLSGDFPRLRRAAEQLFALSAILDAHEAQGVEPVLAGYDALAGRVRASLSRLLELPRRDVEGWEAAAARWLRLARRRVLLDREIGRCRLGAGPRDRIGAGRAGPAAAPRRLGRAPPHDRVEPVARPRSRAGTPWPPCWTSSTGCSTR